MQGRGVAGHSPASTMPPMHATGPWPQWFKRPADLIVAIPLLLALAPLMAVTVILIRLDSPGQAIYAQRRLGRDGRPFRIWKFRSMYVGTDDGSHRQAAADWFAGVPAPDGYKLRNDPRVTRVGRLLRRTSLDELPQLFNVVRGDMSLVGPRPAIAYELDHYTDWFYERFAVRPGVTGVWQVTGRDWVPASEMMRMDCDYVHRCSPWIDLKILALTVPSLLGLSASKRARIGRAGT
jgi:lipopolysaccharide/colanic/teichoic acid biosynthesis glycosyltransferase